MALPLSGPAYEHAQAAYNAYAAKRFDIAAAEAQEALRQRPDARSLRHLLVAALAAGGHQQEAARAARSFLAQDGTDQELAQQLRQIEAGAQPGGNIAAQPTTLTPAYRAAQRAYRAYARQNFALAEREARKAVHAAPRNAAYQRLLRRTIAAQHGEALASPGAAAAQQSYQLAGRGAYAAAEPFAREAVQAAPSNVEYRQLLVEVLSHLNHPHVVMQAVDEAIAQTGPSATLYAARGYAQVQEGQPAGAADDFARAVAMQPLPAEQRVLRLALADAAQAAGQPQRAIDALQPLGPGSDPALASRRGAALLALHQPSAALVALDQVRTTSGQQAASPSPAEQESDVLTQRALLSTRIQALAALRDYSSARAALQQGRKHGALAGQPPLDEAYLALAAREDELALADFRRAESSGALRGRSNLDAGYTATRLGQNQAAIDYFKRGLDADSAHEMALAPQERFNIRRQISEMDRQWRALVSFSYGPVGVMPGTSDSAGALTPNIGHRRTTDRVAQVGAEVSWRPPGIGYQNGRVFELFLRSFDTLADADGGATGASTTQAYTGARWKPFSAANLVLEASRAWALGRNARNDWMLRAAYSLGEGTDLRVDTTSWLTWQTYADVAHYVQSDETLISSEARLGRSFRVTGAENNSGDGLVLTPFISTGFGYDSFLDKTAALGAGGGVSARWWFRSDRNHAPRSYLDISLQYRFKLVGGDNARGLFAGVTLSF